MAVGEPASTCTEFEKKSPDPDVEIVTTSGYGKNGAICVLQRTIKPQVAQNKLVEFLFKFDSFLWHLGCYDV